MDCWALSSRRLQQPAGPSHRCQPSLHNPLLHSKPTPPRNHTPFPHPSSRSTCSPPAATRITYQPAPEYNEPLVDNAFRLQSKHDTNPDVDDPDWVDKVEDWHDFWNYSNWDDTAADVDDEEDAQPMNAYQQAQRAVKLASAIKSIETRTDVVQMLGPTTRRNHLGNWEFPPMEPESRDLYPLLNASDVRAISEKRRKKELMDLEWRRLQSTVGKLQYPHANNMVDARLHRFAYQESKVWSEEDIYNLITNNGINARPEDHQGVIENPLIHADYVNSFGVSYIEETEEFLERIGHLAVDETKFTQEIVLTEEDFDEDEGGDEMFERDEDELLDDVDEVDAE